MEFSLDELDFGVKEEKLDKPFLKPRVPVLRSKSSSKKRKPEGVINVDAPEEANVSDVLEKLQAWTLVAIKGLQAERDEHAQELARVEELRMISISRADDYEKKFKELEKVVAKNEQSNQRKMMEVMEGAKKSATRAILQSRLKMAVEAKAAGCNLWDKDVPAWQAKLDELNGAGPSRAKSDVTNSKKSTSNKGPEEPAKKDEVVAEAEEVASKVGEVETGKDGNDAQT